MSNWFGNVLFYEAALTLSTYSWAKRTVSVALMNFKPLSALGLCEKQNCYL